jgi:Fe-S cluster biosynthesis and repair protein YggX
MTRVDCQRCQKSGEALSAAPIAGDLGRQVLASTCAECWDAWKAQETMVINEYRLRLFDRGDRARLDQICRVFLGLSEGDGPRLDFTPPS